MQVVCTGAHCYFHNYFPFTIILASALGIIQVYLSWQVTRLRRRYKTAIGEIKQEIYHRRNGALNNFNANTPIVLILYALAENNRVNCGLLFFFGGLYLYARLMHIYSLYHYETKTKRYYLRVFAMASTFAVILALAGLNLYKLLTHFPY